MLFLVLPVLAIVIVAALVVAYVAYPQRGRDIPRAPWLSGALRGLVDRTGLDPDEDEAATGGSLNALHEQWRAGPGSRLQGEPGRDERLSPAAPRR